MLKMTTQKKQISYLLIDILVIIFITSVIFFDNIFNRKSNNEYAIEIIMWNPKNSLELTLISGPYHEFCITGNKEKDNTNINEIKDYLFNFNLKKDTIGFGLHIVFEDNSNYGNYIEILNYLVKEEIKCFIPYQNNLWIYSKRNLTR